MPAQTFTITETVYEHSSREDDLSSSSITLDDTRPQKTLDFGADGLVCSVGILGDIIALSTYHPKHGMIVANPFEQFPGGDKFWDSSFVRAYRRKFLDYFDQAGSGFGVKLLGKKTEIKSSLVDGRWPRVTYRTSTVKVGNTLTIANDAGLVLVNRLTLTNTTHDVATIEIDFGGHLSLNRASYGQLTEAGPISIPPCINRLRYENGVLTIENQNLPAVMQCALYINDCQHSLTGASQNSSMPLEIHHLLSVHIPPYATNEIKAYYQLRPSSVTDNILQHYNFRVPPQPAPPSGFIFNDMKRSNTLNRFIIRRTLDYILSCCCIPIDPEAICVLTDHIALPLGWHRDNYWQMRFLRIVKSHAKKLFAPFAVTRWVSDIDRILHGHLVWIFDHANRTEGGFWGRSYLANGKLKDRHVFQLDQQCYPLLELAEYLDIKSITPTQASRWGMTINEILDVLLTKRASDRWLFQTSETPGDDPVAMEYHFSSNILLWHALRKLIPHTHTLHLSHPIDKWANEIQQSTLESFTTTHNGEAIFAYLTDLNGSFEIYHDANDLPSVLAPEWSFCKSDDPRWGNLFKFAFSSENARAYFPNGLFAGLGSVHTTHPWPLGDAQEMIYTLRIGDKVAFEDATARALKKMQWDGSFAEANDEYTGDVRSKHWFSWPGSVIAGILAECDM